MDTIKCACGAVFTPVPFVRGYDANGRGSTATENFVVTGEIPAGTCPVCGRDSEDRLHEQCMESAFGPEGQG